MLHLLHINPDPQLLLVCRLIESFFNTVMSSGDQGGLVATRQVKEAAFLRRVREISIEERANQLRWYVSFYMYMYYYMYALYLYIVIV